MTTTATDKQIDYILALANEVTGRRERYLSGHRDTLCLSQRQCRGDLTKAEASAIIKDLLRQRDSA